jgi:hypothetical protein
MRLTLPLLVAASLVLGAAAAEAAPVYVGSWEVDQGPYWTTQPLAYTGQQAAALLFGGSASDYAISTVDANPLDINDMAWYSVLGVSGGFQFAQNYVGPDSSQAPGFYYSGAGYDNIQTDAASAYVDDNAIGSTFINFAFRIADDSTPVPEPLTLSLFGAGLAGAVFIVRARKAAKAVARS